MERTSSEYINKFGPYGGRFVPETLMENLIELEEAYNRMAGDPNFHLNLTCRRWAARPG